MRVREANVTDGRVKQRGAIADLSPIAQDVVTERGRGVGLIDGRGGRQ